METIRNYLDAMFAGMPNTDEVLRAREELWQMMEDKYTELIEEGKSENEAIGTVISEFGNLSEIADTLGLEEVVNEKIKEDEITPKRNVTMQEAQDYLHTKADSAFKLSLGIALLIFASVAPIIGNILGNDIVETISVLVMMAIIAGGILLIVFAAIKLKPFDYIKKDNCTLSMDTTKYLHEEKNRYSKTAVLQRSIGILCCALCWVPSVLLEYSTLSNSGDIGGITIFIFVAVGVLLIVYTAQIMEGYSTLLRVNGKDTVSGNYKAKSERPVEYSNKTVANVMSVYWPTVTCLYLILSFTTFKWGLTWIIWPVAGVVCSVLRRNYAVSEDDS